MTAALRTAHATARSLGRQLRMRGSGPGGRAKRKIWHGPDQAGLLLLGSTSNLASHREELCFILSGTSLSVFLQAASRKHYTSVDHVDNCAWLYRLDYRRSSDAFVLSAERGRPISCRWLNRFHSRSDLSPLSLAQVQIARTSRVEPFEERRPRSRAGYDS